MLDCFGQFLIGAHLVGSISAAFSQLTTAAPCLHSPQEALRDTKATAARPEEALPLKTALNAVSAAANTPGSMCCRPRRTAHKNKDVANLRDWQPAYILAALVG